MYYQRISEKPRLDLLTAFIQLPVTNEVTYLSNLFDQLQVSSDEDKKQE